MSSYRLYKFRTYWLRHPIRTARLRLERAVVHHLYPQRPFITFGPKAEIANLSMRMVDGIPEFSVGQRGYVTDVHVYDGTFNVRGDNATIRDSHIVSRREHKRAAFTFPVLTERVKRGMAS